ncbi:hypothetical protein HED60_14605 [Planctomycetales bacterium ZRK34]|nr:hypothetical protein HED60_14605 [Planctomycetales bacterium ZRK34]
MFRSVMLIVALFLLTPIVRAQVLHTADFEQGGVDEQGLKLQSANDDAITRVDHPVRAGKYAAKTLLRVDDPKVHKGQRAEFSDSRRAIKMNTDYWYALSVFIPDDFRSRSDRHKNAVIFQWHTQQGGPSPMLAIRIRKDHWLITTHAEGKWRVITELPLEKARWTDWVIKANWSPKPTGGWTIWHNGKVVVNEQNIITDYPEAQGPYVKFGQYHSVDEHVPANTVYFDEFRIAGPDSTYADVAPRDD